MKTRTEKEHYIPNKSYLDYFVDPTLNPPALWVYFDKKAVFANADKAISKNITPTNLCKESYLYETPRLPVNSVEKMLANIEANYKHVLDTKILLKKPLSSSDHLAVAYFLSTLEMRTPLNKENSDNFISEVRKKTIHLEEAHMKGENSQLHKELDEAEKQNLMFTQTLITAVQVNRYQVTDMLFLTPQFEDDESFFVTSDFPVSMLDFSLMNSFYPPTPLDATVEVTIPLTPKIALLVNHLGLNGYKEVDFNYVFEINNRTLQRSNKFIISPKKLGDRFTNLNVKRYPQSFVVLYMSEGIRKQRMKRTDTYMRRTVKKVINSIIGTMRTKNRKGDKVLAIDYVEIFSKDEDELNWFVRALKLLGDIVEVSETGPMIKFKKPFPTKSGKITHVKVALPKSDISQQGMVHFEGTEKGANP